MGPLPPGLTNQRSGQDSRHGPQVGRRCPPEEVGGQQQQDAVLQQHDLWDKTTVTTPGQERVASGSHPDRGSAAASFGVRAEPPRGHQGPMVTGLPRSRGRVPEIVLD